MARMLMDDMKTNITSSDVHVGREELIKHITSVNMRKLMTNFGSMPYFQTFFVMFKAWIIINFTFVCLKVCGFELFDVQICETMLTFSG